MPPITVMIKPVSGACDMRCKYCFYKDELISRGSVCGAPMSDAVLEKTVRSALAYADGSLNVVFQGGEPTLAGAVFFGKYIRFVKKYNTRGINVSTSVQTNALNLNADMIDIMKRGSLLAGASLDGTRETHDLFRRDAFGNATYDRVRANISRMKEAGIPVNILCVVTEAVAKSGAAAFDALREYGYLQFIACLDPLSGETAQYSLTPKSYGKFLIDTFDLYEEAALRGGFVSVRQFDNYIAMLNGKMPDSCAMAGRCAPYYVVEADGAVYPCDFYALNEYRLGGIGEMSFARLARSEAAARFLSESRENAECTSCRHRQICRGGCRRERADNANRLCEGYKSFFDARITRLKKLAEKLKI